MTFRQCSGSGSVPFLLGYGSSAPYVPLDYGSGSCPFLQRLLSRSQLMTVMSKSTRTIKKVLRAFINKNFITADSKNLTGCNFKPLKKKFFIWKKTYWTGVCLPLGRYFCVAWWLYEPPAQRNCSHSSCTPGSKRRPAPRTGKFLNTH